MPAANARAIEKARELACDVVILDLEDAVAPEAKALARDQAAAAVRAGGFGRREVVIRVNGLDTPWGLEDLAAAIDARPDAILAPKVSSGHDVRAYGAVDDPMIVGQRQEHDRMDRDRVLLVLGHHHHALLDLAHPEDGRVRL